MHNPEKNRAVCVLAKSSVWGLRGLLALTVLCIGVVFIVALVIKVRADWNWHQFLATLIFIAVLAVLVGIVYGVGWLLNKWYEWAKAYARDC